MNIYKVIRPRRIYIFILTVLLFQNLAYSQGSAYGYGLLFDLLKNYKDYRELRSAYETKIKGMTTLSGYTYANTVNDNAKRSVNSHYDMEIKKALTKYALESDPQKNEGDIDEVNSYKIYTHTISKIELRRKRDLDRLDQQYNHLIKFYSPYWYRNDQN